MIKLHLSTDNQYYFTVCGKNGQPIVTSGPYKRKASCKRAYLNMIKDLQLPVEGNKAIVVKDLTK